MSLYDYSSSLLVKYRLVWDYYLAHCESHGVDCRITFGQFVNLLTLEQMEMMLEQVGA